jgi:hypothetical protein
MGLIEKWAAVSLQGSPEERSLHLQRVLLALLRAQYLLFHNAHWETTGDAFYGNHLLFQRLYEGDEEDESDEGVQGDVDGLAEKMVGKYGPEAVDMRVIGPLMKSWCDRWCSLKEACPKRRALKSEEDMQKVTKLVYESLKKWGTLSLGMDDFLMAMANKHEANQYLLRQVLRGKQAFTMPPMPASNKTKPTKPKKPGETTFRKSEEEDEDASGVLPPSVSPEMTSLEKSWGGYSSFRPVRRAEMEAAWEALADDAWRFFDTPEDRQVREFARTRTVTPLNPEGPFSQLEVRNREEQSHPPLQTYAGWTLVK